MAQVISRRPVIAETRVRARGYSKWDLWWTKWYWGRFFSEFFAFPLSLSFHNGFILIYAGDEPTDVGGYSSET
jgi:hypothetical protein